MKWINVSKDRPCPICGKPDWCRHGELGTHCMRDDSGKQQSGGGSFFVYDQRPSPKPLVYRPVEVKPEHTIDADAIWRRLVMRTNADAVADAARKIGVSPESLESLGTAWAPGNSAWAFPMRDGNNRVVGIRLRADNGKKWAITGSRQGLFIPNVEPQPLVFICEGPTDTAAALTLGLFAIGRPSCQGCHDHLRTALKRMGVRRVVLTSDNDTPGINGAQKLANDLHLPCCLWIPPAKDIREFLKCGGTKAMADSLIRNLVWQQPNNGTTPAFYTSVPMVHEVQRQGVKEKAAVPAPIHVPHHPYND